MNEERQKEGGRAEVREGRLSLSLLLLLKFINTPFIFRQRANRHLNCTLVYT